MTAADHHDEAVGRGSEGLALNAVIPVVEPQCGGRAPAPGDLSLIQALVNSFHNLETRCDEFETPAGLADWLFRHDLLGPATRLTSADLSRALDVREGLRAMLFVNNGSPPDHGAIARLNLALRGPGLFVQLGPDQPPDLVSTQRDLDAAVALFAAIVAVAQLDGRWRRLKACPGRDCGWAFYDHSRNHGSNWCSMSVCGQREKARAYRRRARRGY